MTPVEVRTREQVLQCLSEYSGGWWDCITVYQCSNDERCHVSAHYVAEDLRLKCSGETWAVVEGMARAAMGYVERHGPR